MSEVKSILCIIVKKNYEDFDHTIHNSFLPSSFTYPYLNNMPTKNGIQYYVSTNADKIVKQIQEFIGDTIYSYSIKVDDLSLYND